MKRDADEKERDILREAARRANWDALHGPMHLRSGKFLPEGAQARHRLFEIDTVAEDAEPPTRSMLRSDSQDEGNALRRVVEGS